MYLMLKSRPDLAYALQDVGRFLNDYGQTHWQAVKHFNRYLKRTLDYGLSFSGNDLVLTAIIDSDYAADEDERRSVSGYVIKLGSCTITWSSRKQRIVAKSTAEAMVIALVHCVYVVLFLRQLLKELEQEKIVTTIQEDNQACIAIAENPTQHARSKHISVRYHFSQEHVRVQDIKLLYIESRRNAAEYLTEGLARIQYEYLRDAIKVKQLEERNEHVEDKSDTRFALAMNGAKSTYTMTFTLEGANEESLLPSMSPRYRTRHEGQTESHCSPHCHLGTKQEPRKANGQSLLPSLFP